MSFTLKNNSSRNHAWLTVGVKSSASNQCFSFRDIFFGDRDIFGKNARDIKKKARVKLRNFFEKMAMTFQILDVQKYRTMMIFFAPVFCL